jgi:hypothetical protein
MTPERRKRCEHWLAAGNTFADFSAAVRRAAATPFLAGDSARGWQANFDWLIANRSNARKVLAGEYDAYARARASGSRAETARRGPAGLYAGTGPQPADCGVRVNPAALERIRVRAAKASRVDESGRLAATGEKTAPSTPHDVSDLASACDAAALQATHLGANPIPCLAPKAVGLDAQPRASPPALKL